MKKKLNITGRMREVEVIWTHKRHNGFTAKILIDGFEVFLERQKGTYAWQPRDTRDRLIIERVDVSITG